MPQPYFEMEESRSVTPWVNRLYFESPRASSFLGLRLVTTRHKNLVPLLSGVKPDPMVESGRYAEPIPVKSPVAAYLWRMRFTVARVRPTQPGQSFCRMPWWANASTSCLIPVGVRRSLLDQLVRIEENMQLFIQTCHGAKADFGKWPPKLWFWTPTIPIGIEVKVWSK